MRDEIKELVLTIQDETGAINDLVSAVREQREIMRAGDSEGVDELMNEISDIFFDVQTFENKRADLAKKLAAKFSCGPRVSELVKNLDNDEQIILNGAVDVLTQSVFVLKGEMLILNGLIDQNEKFTSMLLSEYKRLVGDLKQSGAKDFRG